MYLNERSKKYLLNDFLPIIIKIFNPIEIDKKRLKRNHYSNNHYFVVDYKKKLIELKWDYLLNVKERF